MAIGDSNSAYQGTNDPTTGVFTRPSWMEDMEAYRTPQQEWSRFMRQVQPFWQTRVPMADLGQRLQARYMLGAPDMAQQGALQPSFSQFLQDYPSGFGAGGAPTPASAPLYSAGYDTDPAGELAILRARAQQAANAATMAPGAYLSGVTPGTPEFNRRAWYASQFGSDAGESAGANQLAVANLLATRRPAGAGTGAYTGQMGDAIRRAMTNLYYQRGDAGQPQENFLNWYLKQTGTA